MQKHLKYCLGTFVVTLSLSACVNGNDAAQHHYAHQNKYLQQHCKAQLETLQQSSVPLYYDEDDEPVYRELPTIETFHCNEMPTPSPIVKIPKKTKPEIDLPPLFLFVR